MKSVEVIKIKRDSCERIWKETVDRAFELDRKEPVSKAKEDCIRSLLHRAERYRTMRDTLTWVLNEED